MKVNYQFLLPRTFLLLCLSTSGGFLGGGGLSSSTSSHYGIGIVSAAAAASSSAASSSSTDASTCSGSSTSKTMPSQHELVYFDGAGRAEPIRILLHAANIDFIDTRIQFTDWSSMKPTTPLGSLPILKINGVSHVQSLALMRYAAKLAGFYPQDENDIIQALIVDEVLDSINELMSKAPRSQDKDEMKKLRQEFQRTTMKQYASYLETIIISNINNKEEKEESSSSLVVVVVGTKVTVADLAINSLVKAIESGNWDYVDINFSMTIQIFLHVLNLLMNMKR